MRNQLSFKLPKINEKATKERVEDYLDNYRYYLDTLPSFIEPKLTPSYSIVPPTFSNQFHSSTEEVALERMEFEEEREQFMTKILEAVERLKPEEKLIIFNRYLKQNTGYDPDIWMDMRIGSTKYYQIKSKALLRLGCILNIYVKNKS